jgi:hypothetical protein
VNKRTFDLIFVVVVGMFAATTLPRMWAAKKLAEDPNSTVGRVVKVASAA